MTNTSIPDTSVLNYIAGLFDGEGTAGVYWSNHGGKPRWLVVAAVAMCDADPVKLCHSTFGGWYGAQKPDIRRNKPWRPQFVWRVTGKTSLAFAETILPYLRNESKKLQLGKIVSYYRERVNRGV